MLSSRLTSKYQTIIPKEVRKALHLEANDHILFILKKDSTVLITRASSFELEYLNSISRALNEWESVEDENAFRNL